VHIRFARYAEGVWVGGLIQPDELRFDVSLRDVTTGDGQAQAFVALCPKGSTSIGVRAGNTAPTDYLTLQEAIAEAARLRALGHTVTGDRHAKAAGVVS
jgi:hypothetical protein